MPLRPWTYLTAVLALAAAYFASAQLGFQLAYAAQQVTVVWPPSGIALAALLLGGYRLWPGVALGAFLANVTVHEPLPVAGGIALGNTLEAVLGAWLLRHLLDFDTALARLRDVLGLVVLAAGVSTVVAATVGVTSLSLGGVHPWDTAGRLWWTWWLGDAAGDLVMAPVLLTLAAGPRADWPRRQTAEAALLVFGLGAVSAFVFLGGGAGGGPGHPLEYTLFPFVIWAALRFGQRGAAAVTLAASAVAIFGTVSGAGPFVGGPVEENLIQLQLYLAVVAVTGLLLGAALAERRMAERRRAVGYAVTAALGESATLAQAAPKLLRAVCASLDWDVGALWTVDGPAGVLRCVAVWRRPSAAADEFEAVTRGRTFAPGIGLPGRVWSRGQAGWIADVTRDDNFPRAPAAARAGLHGAFGFPVLLGAEVFGVLEFFSGQIQPPDDDLLNMLSAVGSQVGLFIERKRAEEQLGIQAHLLDSIGQAAIATRPDGTIFYWNRAAEVLYGWPAVEVLGRNILEVTPTQMSREQAEAIVDRLRAGETWSGEFLTQRRDGSELPVFVTDTPVRDATGAVVGIVGVSADISERKRAEEAVAKLAAIVESSDDAIVSKDLNGVIATWNAGAERVFGYTADEVIGRPITILLPPDRLDEERMILDRLRRGERIDNFETIRVTKDGRQVEVSITISPIRDSTGQVIGASKIARDITERKRLEEQLRRQAEELAEAGRRKDEFLAMLAHELRNPLAPIRNAVHILKTSGADGATAGQARELLERQVQHLVRLVDDLLDVSRVMRGRIGLRRERLDLVVAVDRAVETAHPAIEAGGHTLTVALPPEPILLDADPMRLAQVLANLLNNAAKYTEHGGRIDLSAGREGDAAVVRVRDTGIGIAAEVLPHIFDLFVQAERSLGRAQGGLGIGLTLVRNLVELHGGSVRAFSDGPGRGSEFVVRLPLQSAEPDAPARVEPPCLASASGSTLRRRILIVDDNVDAAESLATLLRLDGHDVQVAHGGAAALAAAQAEPPEVVFLDIGMPSMDGYEVARQLRLRPALRDVLLVALTGWGQTEDRQRTQEAGFDRHLVKPVEPEQVRRILAG